MDAGERGDVCVEGVLTIHQQWRSTPARTSGKTETHEGTGKRSPVVTPANGNPRPPRSIPQSSLPATKVLPASPTPTLQRNDRSASSPVSPRSTPSGPCAAGAAEATASPLVGERNCGVEDGLAVRSDGGGTGRLRVAPQVKNAGKATRQRRVVHKSLEERGRG